VCLLAPIVFNERLDAPLQSPFAGVNAAVLFYRVAVLRRAGRIWGLLMGAPLVAIVKVMCDRVESLKPAGELLRIA
jgi:predicted PurR-regulated permease PerM